MGDNVNQREGVRDWLELRDKTGTQGGERAREKREWAAAADEPGVLRPSLLLWMLEVSNVQKHTENDRPYAC